MLKIKPPNYKFCPFCGKKLSIRMEEGKKRKYCKKDKWTYYPYVFLSAVAIIREGNKILLTKRNRNPYKEKWMFPGGFLEYGEHPKETLVREIKEETNLDVVDLKLLDIIQTIDDPRAPGHFVIFYLAKVKGKMINLDKDENIEIEWFEIKNPPKIGWGHHKYMLKKLQKGEI